MTKGLQIIMQNQGDFLDEDTLVSDDATKAASQQSIKAYVDSGGGTDEWQVFSLTITRTGDFTFTVSGDYTTTFRTGTKVQYNDGSVDYGCVSYSEYATGTTTVYLLENDDFAMAAATISSVYYSNVLDPAGWPGLFNFTPNFTNITVGNGTLYATWNCTGKLMEANITFLLGSTSSLTNPTFTVPGRYVNSGNGSVLGLASYSESGVGVVAGQARQVGTYDVRFVAFDSSGSYVVQSALNGSIPFTWGTGDVLTTFLTYFIE